MSYTEIYKFTKTGNAICFAETHNAFRGAMAVWQILEKRYLPEKKYSRVLNFDNDIREIWDLYNDSRLSTVDKIVLGTTFDNVAVYRTDLNKVIDAFINFEGDTSLKEQAEIIKEELKRDSKFIAIGWNQTSVNCDAWRSIRNNGNTVKYNVLKESKHWFLFEKEQSEQFKETRP